MEVFVGGYGILPYPRHPLKSSHRIHRIHRSFWLRIFSHGFHRIHRSFWRRIFSHRFRRFSQIFRLRFCLLICAHLCLSVGGFLCQKVLCVPRILWDTLSVCFVGASVGGTSPPVSVRRPIRLRSPSDQIVFAARLGRVRGLIGRRTGADDFCKELL